MKTLRRIALVVALIVSMLIPNFSHVAQAASYVANWGQRDVVATYLSQAAKDFYTGNEEYSVVSKKVGGTTVDNAADSDLYKELHDIMKSHHTHETNYDETRDLYKYTDCVNGNTSQLSCFYSGNMLQGEWSTGGKIWNREHTWPNSKGLNGNDENDIMMLRPTTSSLNGDRSNTAYGESDGYYNPTKNGQDIRGDVSRIALYIYTRWENTKYMWGSTGVIESLPLLLKWMEEDPVDTWEVGRNDAVQSITGTRNVFVDYPEYAWLLFGYAVPNDMQTPSNNAKNGLAGGENLPQAPEYKPETPEVDASLEELLAKDSLTIPEVYVVASATPITDKKFYVTGVITDILDTNYGNMYIKDSSGKSLLVYGCYNADGTVSYGSMTDKPDAGDTVKFYSAITVYNNTTELKDARIIEYTPGVLDSESGDYEDKTMLAKFEFGENGSKVHVDGSAISNGKSYTIGDYTLTFNSVSKVYAGSFDAQGNSCIKLGTSSANGSFSFTVPEGVDYIVINAAQYKENTTKLIVNGTTNTLTTSSNFGEYTALTVDTTQNKTITVESNKRAMIDSISYHTNTVTPDPDPDPDPDPKPDEHKHEYSSKVTVPTCTAGGYTTYTCECGHSYTANEVPANGHDYIEGNCSVCGAEDPNYEGGNQGGNEGGENPDHDSSVCTHEGTEWIVTLQPVVGIDGERYKVCEDCGETIVEKIPALTGGFSGDCNSSLDLGTVGLLLSAVATAVVLKKRK